MKRPEFSPAYYRALAAAMQHHAESKTYSGRFLRPHAVPIRELLTRRLCLSILDYGCGKGEQYRWRSHSDETGVPAGLSLEQFWGVMVRKYDPAWPEYSTFPEGPADLVICTHTLGSVPAIDLPAVIGEVSGLARKVLYVAERVGPVRKRVFTTDPMPGYDRAGWIAALLEARRGEAEIWLSTSERGPAGKVTIRERIA